MDNKEFNDLMLENYKKWEDEMMDKYKFIYHIIFDEPFKNHKDLIDAHTHGLIKNYQHPEFQLVISLDRNTIAGIINNLTDRVKEGEVFKDGDFVSDVINNYPVYIHQVDKTLLRVILPNASGDYPDVIQKYTTVNRDESVFGYQCDELIKVDDIDNKTLTSSIPKQ